MSSIDNAKLELLMLFMQGTMQTENSTPLMLVWDAR